MINKTNNSIYANYAKPAIDWTNKNKFRIITAIAICALGIGLYSSPAFQNFAIRNVKFVTVVIPVAYTLTFPLGLLLCGFASDAPGSQNTAGQLFESYCSSIQKTWEIWFRFVGITTST